MACHRLILLLLLFATLLVSGCSKDHATVPPDAPPVAPPAGTGDSQLQRFADCDEVGRYLTELQQAQSLLVKEGLAMPPAAPTLNEAPSADAPAADDTGGRSYSSTNIQEAGVDEPDFVKTDGEHIYLVSGGTFLVLRGWPAAETREVARLASLPGTPLSLFVHGDTALVFSQRWHGDGLAAPSSFPTRPGDTLTTVSFIDLSDRGNPQIRRSIHLQGQFRDARMIDGKVHLVTQSWLLDGGEAGEIFPYLLDDRGGATASAPVCSCDNLYRPDLPQGKDLLTVTTLELSNDAPPASISIMGNAGDVYASGGNLYIAASASDFWGAWPATTGDAPQQNSQIHRFALGSPVTYAGSGEVPGRLLNQFSMSEHEGVLRVATTEDEWRNNQRVGPHNRVLLLKHQDGQLREVGRLEGLGKPGERIFAVRFQGARGFVVTFEQIDPLYTLDLSEPAAPKKVGELEVPGVSTYLQPLGEDRLLAIGRNAQGGVDLSLFDVGDFAAPRLVRRLGLGADSWSEAQYEHKAFSYFPRQGLLAVPISAWRFAGGMERVSELVNGLHVYAVDPQQGFALRGTVDHAQFFQAGDYWYRPSAVRRGFFIGDAVSGDFLYSVSDRGLKVTPFADLGRDVAALALPAPADFWKMLPEPLPAPPF